MIRELNAQLAAENLSQVIDEAVHAFWAEIAKGHPHIKSGDLDPGTVFAFEQAAEKAVQVWLEFNEPKHASEVDANSTLFKARRDTMKNALKSYDFNAQVRAVDFYEQTGNDQIFQPVMDSGSAEQSAFRFVVDFFPSSAAIKQASAFDEAGNPVGEDTSVRLYSTTTAGNIELTGVSYEDAHEAKWRLIGQGVEADVVSECGMTIPESDPVLAAKERLFKIATELTTQGRYFDLNSDPANAVSSRSGAAERMFDDAETNFLRKELAAARAALGNEGFLNAASAMEKPRS